MLSDIRRTFAFGACCAVLVAIGILATRHRAAAEPAAAEKTIDVELCDGQTHVQIAANTAPTPEEGRKIADALMTEWRAKNPDTDWIAEEASKHKIVQPADNRGLVGQAQAAAYGLITNQDVLTWERETLAMVTRGSTVFHSGDELGSTVAVSCDMCHPDAANTHPETYPKYQLQLGRTVLLRDMINWCIEHPVRGTKLDADDPKMRALEAYITAQRKGKALDYGRR
jgi:thiosulfate dehydrogenase